MSHNLREQMTVKIGPTTIRTVAAMACLTLFALVALDAGYNGRIVWAYFGLMATLAGVEMAFPRQMPNHPTHDEPDTSKGKGR